MRKAKSNIRKLKTETKTAKFGLKLVVAREVLAHEGIDYVGAPSFFPFFTSLLFS